MFATVQLMGEIILPEFEHGNPSEYNWQSKQGIDVYSGPYRITNNGRLERRETKTVEKTDEEKQEEAEKYGFDSWEDYYSTVEKAGIDTSIENNYPIGVPTRTKQVDEWWADHNQHGSFKFYQYVENTYYSYEARFTRGELDEILLLTKEER